VKIKGPIPPILGKAFNCIPRELQNEANSDPIDEYQLYSSSALDLYILWKYGR
jgi:hypothetical protein